MSTIDCAFCFQTHAYTASIRQPATRLDLQDHDLETELSYLLDDLIQYLGHTNTPEERMERATRPLLGRSVYTALRHFTKHGGWDKTLQWLERRKMVVYRTIPFHLTASQLSQYLCIILDDLKALRVRFPLHIVRWISESTPELAIQHHTETPVDKSSHLSERIR